MFGSNMMGLGSLKGLRFITSSRVSQLTEDSHSSERQTETTDEFGVRNEMIKVGVCEDINVSGAVKPWERPELGPWLRGEKGHFDAILVTTVDRISRSLTDFMDLRQWCIKNGKKLIVIACGMDLASEEMIPNLLGNLLAMFADLELRIIKARFAGGRKTTKALKKSTGGHMAYFHQSVPHESGKGKVWVLHPERAQRTLEMVRHIEEGGTRNALAVRFNNEDVPLPSVARNPEGLTAQGKRNNNRGKGYAGKWTTETITAILTNPKLVGQFRENEWVRTPEGKQIRVGRNDTLVMTDAEDEHGNLRPVPVDYCEPLLVTEDGSPDHARFERLQALLTIGGKRAGSGPLVGVVECLTCGAPAYERHTQNAAKRWYHHFRCYSNASKFPGNPCRSPVMRAADVFGHLTESFLTTMGEREVCLPVHHQAKDYSLELELLSKEYLELVEIIRTTPAAIKPAIEKKYEPRKAELNRRIEYLAAQPQTPARTEWTPTGKTLREHWSADDWHHNGNLLRQLGIKLQGDGRNNWKILYPEDIDDRLRDLKV